MLNLGDQITIRVLSTTHDLKLQTIMVEWFKMKQPKWKHFLRRFDYLNGKKIIIQK